MTVHQLLASLDSSELTEWMAYLQLEAEREKPQADDPENWKKAFNCG
jgi:hypothetical protein